MMEWQPIETAPKDGSMILLGKLESADDESGPVSTAGRWQEGWDDSSVNLESAPFVIKVGIYAWWVVPSSEEVIE